MSGNNPDAAIDETTIRPRDRDAIIQSLQAGLVPRRGLQHIQVGRAQEVKAVTEIGRAHV